MKVEFTEAAKNDLLGIEEWIAADNPERALSFCDELITCCEELAERSRLYPLVARYQRHQVRRRLHGNYLIFYRALDERIEILRILNGARDYEALLFDD